MCITLCITLCNCIFAHQAGIYVGNDKNWSEIWWWIHFAKIGWTRTSLQSWALFLTMFLPVCHLTKAMTQINDSIPGCKNMFSLRLEFIEAGSWDCIQRRPAVRQPARQPSWAFLTPSATHKECAFLPLSELKNLTSLMFLLERPIQFQKSWLENYQNRMHCQLKLRGQRLFQKKKWDPITSWYTAAIFYPALLPENPFFGYYRLKIGKRYTDLFKSHLCAVHFG